jgi:hypothetical protein
MKLGDIRAYNYFYSQIRNDVLASKITEIIKPAYSDEMLRLCIMDMLVLIVRYGLQKRNHIFFS